VFTESSFVLPYFKNYDAFAQTDAIYRHYVRIVRLVFLSSLPSRSPKGTKTSFQKDIARIAKFSFTSKPNRAKIVSSQHGATRGPKNFTAIDPAKPLTRQSCIFSVLPTAPLVHAPTTSNWVRPVAGPLYGVSKYFFTSRNPLGTYTENFPLFLLPFPLPPPATFIPALLRDKGCACLYLKAADRMKCTMELSPHVAFREVKDVFRDLAVLPPRVSRFRKRTLLQKCLPDAQQHVYSRI